MSKKIVFMGTPKFSIKTLEALEKSSYEIVCVYTQPPKKSARGQNINPSPIQIIAERLSLKVRSPNNLDSEEELKYFKSLNPYIAIVVAYGKIIPENYLDIPEKGFLNIHASLLPKLRGAAPIQRAIMNMHKESGISFMKIQKDLDTGPCMMQISTKINEQTSSSNLSNELSNLGAKNIVKCLELIKKNNANFSEQDHTKTSYAKKIDKKESKIMWDQKADIILAKINGLNPKPGAWFELAGSRYKIWKAKIINLQGNPGELINKNMTICCKDKAIQILEIQKEGKKKLSIKDFLKGAKINFGKNFT